MEPGIYFDIPNEKYHAGPGISNSGLADILQSPFHYWSRHLDPNRPEREVLSGQEDGTLTHCGILEPDQLLERYVVGPDINKNRKDWKEFCALHPDKIAIKPDQYTRTIRQREAVWAIPDIAEALSNGRPEVSAYWEDPETGVLCRCRPDFVHNAGAGDILIDVKTFTDARPEEFARQCARKDYHRQAKYYSDGYAIASGRPVLGFIFLAVETAWPFSAHATMLDEDSIEAGRAQYRTALDIYADCLAKDQWPGYPQTIDIMRLPPWKMESAA